jgi:hypothetical protein
MREAAMSNAYRCDQCGQFRDGVGLSVEWFVEDDRHASGEISLCPDCAPPVVEPLVAIAATKHTGPVAEDAVWTSESDG